MSHLVYYKKAMSRAQWKTLSMGCVWLGLFWAFTYKSRKGVQHHVHDAYMSQDENSVKRRGHNQEFHQGHGYAMGPVNLDQTDYQKMVNALQLDDISSRPRSSV